MGFRGVVGHEFVGQVVACHEPAWVGQRVVGEINAACRRCAVCARGDESHCPERTTLGIDRRDGAMAELFSLPVACLHAVPDGLPDLAAVFAEPLAAALEILEQTHLRPTDRVAVVGDGKLGLLCAQVLRLPGCAVAVVGRHPERWGLLHAQGITTVHAAAFEQGGTKDKEPRTENREPGVSIGSRFSILMMTYTHLTKAQIQCLAALSLDHTVALHLYSASD